MGAGCAASGRMEPVNNVVQLREGFKPEEKVRGNARAPRAHVRVERVRAARTRTPCKADMLCTGRYVFSTPSFTLGHNEVMREGLSRRIGARGMRLRVI